MTQFTAIRVRKGPLGVSALCPRCGKGCSVRYRDGFRPGLHANQAARKLVWDHMQQEHPEAPRQDVLTEAALRQVMEAENA